MNTKIKTTRYDCTDGRENLPMEVQLKKRCDTILSMPPSRNRKPCSYKETNFIYNMKSFSECLDTALVKGVDEKLALLRWYRYMTKRRIVELFRELAPEFVEVVSYEKGKGEII